LNKKNRNKNNLNINFVDFCETKSWTKLGESYFEKEYCSGLQEFLSVLIYDM